MFGQIGIGRRSLVLHVDGVVGSAHRRHGARPPAESARTAADLTRHPFLVRVHVRRRQNQLQQFSYSDSITIFH